MELHQAIWERHSVRGFTDQNVPKELLEKVLQSGVRAVSAVNLQPWEFVVLTGEALKKVAAENIECLRAGRPFDQEDVPPLQGVYQARRKEIGIRLLSEMGIAREDKEGRQNWLERGFRFFDAPAVILLLMDKSLDETMFRFDMGCVTQNICLAAMEYGLGTCVEYQAVLYHEGFRKYLQIPESKRFVCGIAIGYPDETFPANRVISAREDTDTITQWYGFEKE